MQFLCLANSRKPPARCVAGLDLQSGKWVRPVSKENSGGLAVHETNINLNGGFRGIQPLDVVEFDRILPDPGIGQPENIERGKEEWIYRRPFFTSELESLYEESPFLMQDNSDRIPEAASAQVTSSLCLISVRDPEFRLNPLNHNQLRAHFQFRDMEFNYAVTDDSTWVDQAKRDPRRFNRGRWAFTVSLGVPFHGSLYKLVAWAHEY